jgi:hypothetical protein
MYSSNPVADYDHYCAQQERAAEAAVREGRAGECGTCQTNTTGQRCNWCGHWVCAECAMYDQYFLGCQLCWQLLEVHGHLGAVLVASLPSDDRINMDHVREANEIVNQALELRRPRRQDG